MAQEVNWAPTYATCGRNHLEMCHYGSAGFVKCGQEGRFVKKCPKNGQHSGNRGNRSHPSSVGPPNRVASRGILQGQAEEQTVFILLLVTKRKRIPHMFSLV